MKPRPLPILIEPGAAKVHPDSAGSGHGSGHSSHGAGGSESPALNILSRQWTQRSLGPSPMVPEATAHGPRPTTFGQIAAAKRAAQKLKENSRRSQKAKGAKPHRAAMYPTREKDDITPDRFSPEAYDKLARKFTLHRGGMAAAIRSSNHAHIVNASVTNTDLDKLISGSTSRSKISLDGGQKPESPGSASPGSGRAHSEHKVSGVEQSNERRRSTAQSGYTRLKSIIDFERSTSEALDHLLQSSRRSISLGLFNVIEYGNPAKYWWDWVIIALTMYSIIMIPVLTAFPEQFAGAGLLHIFEKVSDAFFVVDITLCFRTAYLDEDRFEVKERREIVRRYLRGWFVWDFIASFPLESLSLWVELSPAAVSWLNVNKLVRITRLMKKLDDMVLTGYARIVKLLGTFFVMAHIIACFYFKLGSMQEDDVVGGRWVQVYNIIGQPVHYQYLSSLYWAYATLGTVGYGDIAASSAWERFFALVTMFFGSIMYASIFGTFTNLIQERDRNKSQYNERVVRINDFTRANHLPTIIRKRLLRYHEATWQLRKVEAADVLSGAPKSFQIELMMFLYSDLVTQVPIFSRCSKRFLEQVVMKFDHAIFLTGDYITRQGDKGRELYFVVKGRINVMVCPDASEDAAVVDFDDLIHRSFFVTSRGAGAFIGEGALLSDKRRGASVEAVSPLVQTLYLTKEAFDECVKDSPEVLETIKGVAAFRENEAKDDADNPDRSRKEKAGFEFKTNGAMVRKRHSESGGAPQSGSVLYSALTRSARPRGASKYSKPGKAGGEVGTDGAEANGSSSAAKSALGAHTVADGRNTPMRLHKAARKSNVITRLSRVMRSSSATIQDPKNSMLRLEQNADLEKERRMLDRMHDGSAGMTAAHAELQAADAHSAAAARVARAAEADVENGTKAEAPADTGGREDGGKDSSQSDDTEMAEGADGQPGRPAPGRENALASVETGETKVLQEQLASLLDSFSRFAEAQEARLRQLEGKLEAALASKPGSS